MLVRLLSQYNDRMKEFMMYFEIDKSHEKFGGKFNCGKYTFETMKSSM